MNIEGKAVEEISMGASTQANDTERAMENVVHMGDKIKEIVDDVYLMTDSADRMGENGKAVDLITSIAEETNLLSLYNHFKSKQGIFDSIVELILEHISGLSEKLGIPSYDEQYVSTYVFYENLDLEGLKKISRNAFVLSMYSSLCK